MKFKKNCEHDEFKYLKKRLLKDIIKHSISSIFWQVVDRIQSICDQLSIEQKPDSVRDVQKS